MRRPGMSAAMTRGPRWLAIILAAVVATAWWVADARAQAEPGFPTRNLRIFVPYGPGGVGDLTMRMVAQKLTERMGPLGPRVSPS